MESQRDVSRITNRNITVTLVIVIVFTLLAITGVLFYYPSIHKLCVENQKLLDANSLLLRENQDLEDRRKISTAIIIAQDNQIVRDREAVRILANSLESAMRSLNAIANDAHIPQSEPMFNFSGMKPEGIVAALTDHPTVLARKK